VKDGVVRVACCIPTMGYTNPAAYANRLVNFMHIGKLEKQGELLKETPRFEFFFCIIGRIFTPVARDEAAKMAIEHDCDYLYMIDDDMICPDDMFEKLYKHDVDIIAPLAFTRNPPYSPVLYHSVEGYDAVAKKDYFINNVVMNYPKDTLVESDAVGFGAVLIKRWVLEKVGPKPFMSTCGTGEDILFCYKAKKIGARVFMDTSCKIGHIGHPLHITEEYVEAYRKTNGYDQKKFFDYSTDSKERATFIVS
jgi:GT2 family glycosyltransferase